MFKGLTVRSFCKSFGVKGLNVVCSVCADPSLNIFCIYLTNKGIVIRFGGFG
jgi:hypothetical protein